MESRGFVIREPRKGISVARITRQEAQDIYKIRANIEGLAMSLAVQCQPPGLLETLKKLHEKMIRAAEKGNDAAYQTAEPEIPRTDRRLLRQPEADPADPGLRQADHALPRGAHGRAGLDGKFHKDTRGDHRRLRGGRRRSGRGHPQGCRARPDQTIFGNIQEWGGNT